jgi:alkanesulfonate monooxygenase SsuD/methylene tetrahydromethanopterin reductase-like flavin-dependent oxidoreductase (luciferase family)
MVAGDSSFLESARPDPLPVIMVGAFQPKMLRLTARYTDWWNVSSIGVEPYRRMVGIFAQACAEVGRDPATVRRSRCGGCACAPTEAEAKRCAGHRFSADNEEDFGFVGTPQQIVEQMRLFIALGVDYFMVDCSGFPNLTTLELLVHEVLPSLNA